MQGHIHLERIRYPFLYGDEHSRFNKLDSALETLPPRCKDVFLLAKLQGLKYREIAEKLEVSEKTVENQMTKAIKLLRAYVAAYGALLVTVAAIILSIIINCE